MKKILLLLSIVLSIATLHTPLYADEFTSEEVKVEQKNKNLSLTLEGVKEPIDFMIGRREYRYMPHENNIIVIPQTASHITINFPFLGVEKLVEVKDKVLVSINLENEYKIATTNAFVELREKEEKYIKEKLKSERVYISGYNGTGEKFSYFILGDNVREQGKIKHLCSLLSCSEFIKINSGVYQLNKGEGKYVFFKETDEKTDIGSDIEKEKSGNNPLVFIIIIILILAASGLGYMAYSKR